MIRDRNGLEVLSREECLCLLASQHVGRVALSMAAMPVVLPVNFSMLGDDIVVRTGVGSKLEAAIENAVVAFEVDEIQSGDQGGEGWSVLVQGIARAIDDPEELARARALRLRPWAVSGDNFVKIRTEIVSGRRLIHAGPRPCHNGASSREEEPHSV